MSPSTHDWLLRSRPFLVYPAVIAALLLLVVVRGSIGWGAGLLLAATGLLVWTLIEWVLHRAMHASPRWPGLSRFQDQAHLRHHRARRPRTLGGEPARQHPAGPAVLRAGPCGMVASSIGPWYFTPGCWPVTSVRVRALGEPRRGASGAAADEPPSRIAPLQGLGSRLRSDYAAVGLGLWHPAGADDRSAGRSLKEHSRSAQHFFAETAFELVLRQSG